jgi:hypothetical protein
MFPKSWDTPSYHHTSSMLVSDFPLTIQLLGTPFMDPPLGPWGTRDPAPWILGGRRGRGAPVGGAQHPAGNPFKTST